jgi:hypothetical protein
MNAKEALDLKRLVNESQCDDNTENIRKLKHSVLIRNDIRKLEQLKKQNEYLKTNDIAQFRELCLNECPFLFSNYTDIFNKIIKDELDLKIMTKLLIVLKLIEDGQVDQHEGSVMVGKFLKELYIDSAIKRSDNIDKEFEGQKVAPNKGLAVSWREFKKTREP